MYEQFYGLREKPFSLTPDPDFLFLNRNYREALEQVLYAIKRREGFTVIVGDVGTGKTTLCWALLGRLERNVRSALILNPLLTEEDMLRAILQDYGIHRCRQASPAGGNGSDGDSLPNPGWMKGLTRKELIDQLNQFLLETASEDLFNILIIDEAQNLTPSVLEQLRILSNLETAKKKLLQIIFVGQIEFDEKLRLPHLRQLNQRISIRYELKPLSRGDTEKYVHHRLAIAGASKHLGFTRAAYRAVYRYSRGYPRLINLVCDRAMLAAYSERAYIINARRVRKGARALSGRATARKTGLSRYFRPAVSFPALVLLILLVIALLLVWSGQPLFRVSSMGEPGSLQAATPPRAVQAPAGQSVPSPPPANDPLAAETDPTTLSPGLPAEPPAGLDSRAELFVVQVHSLKTTRQAEQAVQHLKARGYQAFHKLQLDNLNREWFAVFVGPFEQLSAARESLATIGASEGTTPILRRITPVTK